MPRGFETMRSWLLQVTLAALAAFWVWEFLPVLEQLNLLVDAGSFVPLLLTLALLQGVPFAAIRGVGGVLASSFYVWHYFHPAHTPWYVGMRELVSALGRDFIQLMQQQGLVDPLQTTLFTLMLCALYWLVVYSARRQRLWLFYNGLAVLVLALVDGNTSVQPNQALLVILATTLLVLGLNHYASLGAVASVHGGPAKTRFFLPLASVITVIFALATVLPKQAAVWADPFQGGIGQGIGTTGGGTQLVIGYQSNNAHLGGSFAMNYEPVLSVITKYPTYLRGESYSNYTGKGWQHSTLERDPIAPQAPFPLQADAAFTGLASQSVTQKVQVLSNHLNVNVLFGAYAINKVTEALVPDAGGPSGIFVNPMNGNVYNSGNLTLNQTYSVSSQELEDPSALLSEGKQSISNASVYPPEVQQLYLELPPNLPGRIATLAQQVTMQDVTEYDKVMSIESYLQEHYTYATQGIPVPGPTQDYIDQFLFDSAKGYCNNFSSSMAVMLRTLDIPTRWVTGFTYGGQDFNYSGPENRFVIRNADAHSWVEVYFPQVGWVPFDPTPTFSMPFAPTTSASSTQVPPAPAIATPPVKKTPQAKPTPPQGSVGPMTRWGMVVLVGKWTFLVALMVLVAIGVLFRRRLYFARLWAGMTPNALGRAVTHLVRLLDRKRSLPNPAPTLRELMLVARNYGVHEQDYRQFVHTAEKVWYAGESVPDEAMEQARRTWMGWVTRLYKQTRRRKKRVKK